MLHVLLFYPQLAPCVASSPAKQCSSSTNPCCCACVVLTCPCRCSIVQVPGLSQPPEADLGRPGRLAAGQNAAAGRALPPTTTTQQPGSIDSSSDPFQALRRRALLSVSSGVAATAVDKLPPRGSAQAAAHGGGHPLSTKYRLAGVMRELGYSCTASADAFRALLSQFRNLDEQAVAGGWGPGC